MKFEKGDRVGLRDNIYTHCEYNPWHSITKVVGTVISEYDTDEYWLYVKWDTGERNSYEPTQLFLINVDEKIINVDELFEDIEL